MSATDRAKEALLALLGIAVPRVDYFTTYRARVVAQSANLLAVDLKPDDARIPAPSNVKIKWGVPGVTAQINAGAFMHLGWEGGDPSKPYALVIESGATVVKLVLKGTTLYLGDEPGANFVALSNKVQDYLVALATAIDGWTPVAMDGGAALKAALSTAGIIGGTWGTDVAAQNVKAV